MKHSECALIVGNSQCYLPFVDDCEWKLKLINYSANIAIRNPFTTINSFMWMFIRSSLTKISQESDGYHFCFRLHFTAIYSQVTWTSIHYSPECSSLFAAFYSWMWMSHKYYDISIFSFLCLIVQTLCMYT